MWGAGAEAASVGVQTPSLTRPLTPCRSPTRRATGRSLTPSTRRCRTTKRGIGPPGHYWGDIRWGLAHATVVWRQQIRSCRVGAFGGGSAGRVYMHARLARNEYECMVVWAVRVQAQRQHACLPFRQFFSQSCVRVPGFAPLSALAGLSSASSAATWLITSDLMQAPAISNARNRDNGLLS